MRRLAAIALALALASCSPRVERRLFSDGQTVRLRRNAPRYRRVGPIVIDSLRSRRRNGQLFYAAHSSSGMLHFDYLPQRDIK